MKLIITSILLLIMMCANGQVLIHGKVTDKNNIPIVGVNIYIQGTIEGTSSKQNGKFEFETTKSGEQTLVASFIGFQDFVLLADVDKMQDLKIMLKEEELGLDEVVITASTFSIGKSRTLKKMDALDIVMTSGSQGDIFGALQTLPGTQKVGEDGKLYVRGGDDRETQTFIDGIHVLSPYTSTAQNMPARSRYSSFIFKGINFSLGGYDSEYGQALSSVLPMETKDVSTSKIGFNITPVSVGGGGTQSWGTKSVSSNINYTNLGAYNQVLPDRYDWKKAYENIGGEIQLKSELGRNSIHKLFISADKTSFIRTVEDNLNGEPDRDFGLNRNNYYVNSTFNTRTQKNYHWFFGTAYSYVTDNYDNVIVSQDKFQEKEGELHLKTRLRKNVSNFYKVTLGAETYLKNYHREYINEQGSEELDKTLNYNLYSAHMNNQLKLFKETYANISARMEYVDLYNKLNISPRISLNYVKGNFQLSGIVGQYYQVQEHYQLVANNIINRQESSLHYILGGSYDFNGTLLKLELYKKDYEGLGLLNKNDIYTSEGYGNSKGLDLYLTGNILKNRLEYSLSYSYNDSKRLYKHYPIESVPLYNTKHNANITLKYVIPSIRTYVGAGYTYASGRPYNDPNKNGYANSETSAYHSLDLNLTYLLSSKVILHAYTTNLMGRNNIYGYDYADNANTNGIYNREAIVNSRNRFFFLGLFISLNNDTAYDISSF